MQARRNSGRAAVIAGGATFALLLAAFILAPAAGGLAWLRGGHVMPEDLALHSRLQSAFPLSDHHSPLDDASPKSPPSPPPALAFALGGSALGLAFSGIAAVLPASALLLWRAWRRIMAHAPALRLAGRSPAPSLLPPR